MKTLVSDLEKEFILYKRYENQLIDNNKIDLTTISFFYPTFLLPLGILLNQNFQIAFIPPIDPDASRYLEIMLSEPNIKYFKYKNYIPLIKIPKDFELREKMFNLFLTQSTSTSVGGKNAFAYIISELTDNILQHSKYSTAFIMVQKYSKKKFTEISIIDNGISIPGSYEKKGYTFRDEVALQEAVNGHSTKDEYERGYGLRTTLQLLTKGLNAETLIISRNSKLNSLPNKTNYDISKSSYNYSGTLISTRIPFHEEEIEIHDYIY